ncbi:hypothetical protein OTU49_007417 [Cherax quadricarinatus]|uniref:C2H2-type domain-containing protein n=1 Tax=Cherax quadricarinatus TaxID=27406 RepID=A0AAW0WWM5_CHEQU
MEKIPLLLYSDDLEIYYFPCDVCDQTFSKLTNWENHVKEHQSQKLYLCLECNVTLSVEEDLQRHECNNTAKLLDLETQVTETKSCISNIQSSTIMSKHIPCTSQDTDSKSGGTYTLSSTKESKHSPQKVINHKKKGLINISFKCDVCNEKFMLKKHLKEHESKHSGEKNYVCEICGETFSVLASFQFHHHLFHQIKFCICKICGKTVRRKSLNSHLLTHAESKFDCAQCGKKFRRKYSFRRHQTVHLKSIEMPK